MSDILPTLLKASLIKLRKRSFTCDVFYVTLLTYLYVTLHYSTAFLIEQ